MRKVDEHERARFRPFWEAKFLELLQRISRYARNLTGGDESAAADLVNDVFVRMLKLCPDPSMVGTPEGYLIRMTHNLWVDTTRRAHRGIEISLSDPALSAIKMPTVSPKIQQILELEELFRSFEDACRCQADQKMYELYLDGHSIEEIALIMGSSLESAKVRWRRLKQRAAYRVRQTERMAAGTN